MTRRSRHLAWRRNWWLIAELSAFTAGMLALMGTEEPGADQVARVIELVAEAGGLEYARERAQRFALAADAELDRLPASPARESLRASITYVLERRR